MLFYATHPVITALLTMALFAMSLLALFTNTFLFVRKLYHLVKDIDGHTARERKAKKYLPLMVKSSLLTAIPMIAMAVGQVTLNLMGTDGSSRAIRTTTISLLVLLLILCDYLSVALLLRSNSKLYQRLCSRCDKAFYGCMVGVVHEVKSVKRAVSSRHLFSQ